jgi:hypothetical protein
MNGVQSRKDFSKRCSGHVRRPQTLPLAVNLGARRADSSARSRRWSAFLDDLPN